MRDNRSRWTEIPEAGSSRLASAIRLMWFCVFGFVAYFLLSIALPFDGATLGQQYSTLGLAAIAASVIFMKGKEWARALFFFGIVLGGVWILSMWKSIFSF